MLAPILVFAYRRPEKLKALINSLLTNELSKFSTLYIFSDGASKGDEEAVRSVRNFIVSIQGFKEVKTFFPDINSFLLMPIIRDIFLKLNEKIILLEDDNIVSPNFLSYMNSALDKYEKHSNVFSVCGHTHTIDIPPNYEFDTYFSRRYDGYGVGLWSSRGTSLFEKINIPFLLSELKKPNIWKEFEQSGFDLISMISHEKDNHYGDVRASINSILTNYWQVYPTKSLVINNGLDGSGANCGALDNDYLVNGSYSAQFNAISFANEPNELVLNAHAMRWKKGCDSIVDQLRLIIDTVRI